jgi:hypothetical protein
MHDLGGFKSMIPEITNIIGEISQMTQEISKMIRAIQVAIFEDQIKK